MNNKKKFKSVFQLFDNLNKEPQESMDKKYIKNYNKFIQDDNKTKYNIHHLSKIILEDRIDMLYSLAWIVFTHEYGVIPSELIYENDLKIEFFSFLKKNGKLIHKRFSSSMMESCFLFSYDDMYISFHIYFTEKYPEGKITACCFYNKPDKKIDYDSLSEFIIDSDDDIPKIGIIKVTKYGPAVTWIDHVTKFKFNEKHYNSDFPDSFNNLKNSINMNDNGLYLMYGEAGTGKSSAIRHLITQIDKKVVFIPPQMINCLSNPDFTELVTNELKNCVLVIEDAEKALMKRESADGFFNSELVSSILNLTDGLYADICKTSVIATYNCDRNLVDPALLRKGRLRWEYHFNKLELERTKELMKSLGHEDKIDSEMTLADIFNYKQQFSNQKTSKSKNKNIGFAQ